MNYKELLFNKDKVLSFYPELAVILNKYDKILAEEKYEKEKQEKPDSKKRKAGTLGLNEAIIINQINYWNEINKKTGNNFKDGYYWTYNTYDKWAENDFPYWSADTIRKSITALENIGVIISTDIYNTYKIDNTKWYRIDYKKLQEIIDIVKADDKKKNPDNEPEVSQEGNVSYDCVNASYIDGLSNSPSPIPDITTENTYSDSKANSFFVKKVGEWNKFHNPPEINQDELKQRIYDVAEDARIDLLPDNQADNVERCIFYFIDRYAEVFGQKHPQITERTIYSVIANITGSSHFDRGEFITYFQPLVSDDEDDDSYEEIIDMYFQTEFSQDIDYSIVHFSQAGVLTKLMGHATEKTWFYNSSI